MIFKKIKQSYLLKAWNLDYPSERFGIKVVQGRYLVQGWVLFRRWVIEGLSASQPYISFTLNDHSELRFPFVLV